MKGVLFLSDWAAKLWGKERQKKNGAFMEKTGYSAIFKFRDHM